MKKIIFSTILCVISFVILKSQDIHFTQQFDNDIYLNPAQSGLGKKANRLLFQYRDQWRTVPAPFATAYISYDRKLFTNEKHLLGGGLQFLYDKVGEGSLSTIQVDLSPAYTYFFNDKKIGLSVGAQLGIIHRFLDTDALIFESQYDGIGINNPSGEALNGNATAFNLGAGIHFSAQLGEKAHVLETGFSSYNMHQPNLSILENSADEKQIRYNTYANAEVRIGNSWSINPVFQFQRQERANNILPLLYAKKYINKEKHSAVSFGGGYRVDDAAIIYAAYEIKDFKIGFNYDINTSSFNDVTRTIGAGEILLKYEWERKKQDELVEIEIDTLILDTLTVEEIVEEEEEEIIVEEPEIEEPIVVEEPVIETPVIEEVKEPSIIDQVNMGTSVLLYFPNDYPDPRTYKTTTSTSYEEVYNDYLRLIEDYDKNIGLKNNSNEFINSALVPEWNRFNLLVAEIKNVLEVGKSVTIFLRGYTSPLGSSAYNDNLSKRRIQSVKNQIQVMGLDKYIESGQLAIKEVAFGEHKANDSISDDRNDTINSIYSNKAAYERKVDFEQILIK